MAMFAPVFARGKTNVKTITTLAAGSKAVTLTGPAAPIAVGSHIFASDSGGANAEYLGKATAVSGGQVTTQYKAQASHNGGSLWTPATHWQALTVLSAAAEQTEEPGIEALATGGGQVNTQTRDFLEFVEFTWSRALRSDRAALKVWVRTQIANGRKNFTAAWVDRDTGKVVCAEVKFRNPGREWEAREEAFVLRTWAVELLVVARGTYY